ncbi:MAG: helix-turn-helix domain-containing protein [Stappiaceae bacterium]
MPRDSKKTRQSIIDAANQLFYAEGIRAVSVDRIAEEAGITKRTLYYHFESKDDLAAAYLTSRDQPNLDAFRRWYDRADGDVPDKVEALFAGVARAAQSKTWRGCGFLRTAGELANMPGHPAIKAGAAHKKRFENWLSETFEAAEISNANARARQVVLLMDGAFSTVMVHHDVAYIEEAGRAARALTED